MNRKWMSILLSVALAVSLFAALPAPRALAANTCYWNPSGFSTDWATAANWTGCGGVTPGASDTVVLDNTYKPGDYTVSLPSATTTITITKLTISPDPVTTIVLMLPSGNTANPGLSVGDNTPNTDDIVLESGAVLLNSSGAGSGNGIQVYSTASGTVVIKNGAKYTHNTGRSTGGIVPRLSTAVGTETGIFEYDSSGTGSVAISASGRNYGSLYLNRTAGAATYTSSGSSALTVRGDFMVGAGVTYNTTMTATMNLAGSLTHNGAAISFGMQTVNLNGASAQTIGGSTSTTFAGLTINNAAGVSLGIATSVANTLTLTSGLLTLGANTLTLGSSATVVGTPAASNMVVADGSGTLCKTHTGTGSFTFPIGDNTGTAEYSPVALNVTALTGSGDICFNLVDAVYPNKLAGANDYITRYWVGSKAAGITDLTYDATFTYVDADVQGTEGNMSGKKWDGTLPWTTLGAVNTGLNTFIGSSLTSFSDFTAFDTPLAAPLSSLDATAVGGRIVVAWETTSELGSQGYHVYRADAAGGGWTRLNAAMIPSAAPGGTSGHAYTWTDATAGRGAAYQYRVAAVGLDGGETPLEVVSVMMPVGWYWLPVVVR